MSVAPIRARERSSLHRLATCILLTSRKVVFGKSLPKSGRRQVTQNPVSRELGASANGPWSR